MSDYYGRALLEDWLMEEVFSVVHLPYEVITIFEPYREQVEADIERWMESDDGYGNPQSWRGWGRGFASIPDDDNNFERLVEQGKRILSIG